MPAGKFWPLFVFHQTVSLGVDPPVITRFQESFNNWQKFLQLKDNGLKAQLDLWEANRLTLLEAGILNEHLTTAKICTYCHPDLLYSYRYDNGKTGRLAGIIMLNDHKA